MEGEVHNSIGPAGCCPNMILHACSNYGDRLKGLRLRGNELGINFCTYQDISESARVQGDFTNLFGTWRSAALAEERPPLISPHFSAYLIMRFLSPHVSQMDIFELGALHHQTQKDPPDLADFISSWDVLELMPALWQERRFKATSWWVSFKWTHSSLLISITGVCSELEMAIAHLWLVQSDDINMKWRRELSSCPRRSQSIDILSHNTNKRPADIDDWRDSRNASKSMR